MFFHFFSKMKRSFPVLSYLLAAIWTLCLFSACKNRPIYLDVPYVATPDFVVDRMLQMAEVGPGDYLIDLGSGDGRIVIAAAKRGAFGHGIELDPERIQQARKNARDAQVEDRVVFVRENIFRTDFSSASVVTMYLLASANKRLRPRLFELLRPGTRVVSHQFDMGEWEPDNSAVIEGPSNTRHEVFLWHMPARVGGQWGWTLDDKQYHLEIRQQYQEIDLRLWSGQDTLSTGRAVLHGKRMRFTASNSDTDRLLFNGSVTSDRINGIVQIHSGDGKRLEHWSAHRESL